MRVRVGRRLDKDMGSIHRNNIHVMIVKILLIREGTVGQE
jgi:hypothetical protein